MSSVKSRSTIINDGFESIYNIIGLPFEQVHEQDYLEEAERKIEHNFGLLADYLNRVIM